MRGSQVGSILRILRGDSQSYRCAFWGAKQSVGSDGKSKDCGSGRYTLQQCQQRRGQKLEADLYEELQGRSMAECVKFFTRVLQKFEKELFHAFILEI